MTVRQLSLELDLDAGKFSASMKTAAGDTVNFSKAVDSSAKSLKNIENAVTSPMARLRDFTLVFAGVRDMIHTVDDALLGWVGSMVTATAQIEKTTKMLYGMSTAMDDAGKKTETANQLDYLFNLAKNAPYSLGHLTDAFVKLKSAGLDPMDGTLKGITEAVARFGGSDQSLERAALAIQQMAGKGVVSMEELRRQLGEAVPTAINMMAAGMGMSYATLVKNISAGTVESKTAIEKMVAMFNLAYGGSAQAQMETFTGKMSRLKTSWIELSMAVTGLDREGNTVQGGFFDTVKHSLDTLIETMNNPDFKEFGVKVGDSFNSAVKSLMGFANVLGSMSGYVDVITVVKDALLALAAVMIFDLGAAAKTKLLEGLTAVSGALGTIRNAAITLADELLALNAMFATGKVASAEYATAAALAGGALKEFGAATLSAIPVIGILLTTLYTVADAFGLFTDHVEKAKQAVDDFNHTGFTTKDNIKEQQGQVDALKAEIDKRTKTMGKVEFAGSATGWITATPAQLADQKRQLDAMKAQWKDANDSLTKMQTSFNAQQADSAGRVNATLVANAAGIGALQDKIQRATNDLYKTVTDTKGDPNADAKIAAKKTEVAAQVAEWSNQIGKIYQGLIQKDTDALATLDKHSQQYRDKFAERKSLMDAVAANTNAHDGAALEKEDVFVNGKNKHKSDPVTGKYDTMMETLAGLKAKLTDTGVAAAKMVEQLRIDPQFIAAPEAMKEKLMGVAEAIDKVNGQITGKKAFDKLQDDALKQAEAVKNLTAQMYANIAGMDGGSSAAARYAATLAPLVKESKAYKDGGGLAEQAANDKQKVDALTESNKDWAKIQSEITGSTAEAAGLFADLALGQDHASLTLERYKRTMAELVSKEMPEMRAAARQQADAAIAAFSQVEAGKAMEDMRSKVKSINESLLLDAADKSHLTTQTEINDMFKRVDWTRLTAEQRKAAEADFYAYVNAIRRKDAQDSKTELEKMADQWARLGDQMDKAATGWVSNFVDGLATGKMNMADFARSVLEGLAKIIIQALIAKAIIAALGAFGLTGAQDSNLSIPTPGGIPFGDSIGAVGASVVQAHSGGVLGGDRGMASMVVDPSIFTNAMKYHVGGIAGLRPGEVPAVLQEGEGVFTKAQMAAMGGGQQPVNVQVNVVNQSGQQLNAAKGQQSFDGRQYVIDVVVDAMTRPGPMRDAVRSTT